MEQPGKKIQTTQGIIGIFLIGVGESRIDPEAGVLENHQGALHVAEGGDQQDALAPRESAIFLTSTACSWVFFAFFSCRNVLRRDSQALASWLMTAPSETVALPTIPPEKRIFFALPSNRAGPPHHAVGGDQVQVPPDSPPSEDHDQIRIL